METIHANNRLSEHASDFFNRLRDYLDTKLYLYFKNRLFPWTK